MRKTPFGLIAAPFTPMDKEGNLKLDVIDTYAKHITKSHLSGVFICGTSGEATSLSVKERKAVLEKWISQAESNIKIICHVGSNSINDSIELASHAQATGAKAIGSFAPSFFKPSNAKELVDFLAPIAAAAPDLPFYYYNIPSFTGVNIPVSEVLAMADMFIPTFAGVKYTHYDLYDMQKCIAYGGCKYEILHGYDETLLCGLSLGVNSAVGSTYNHIPKIYQNIIDAFDENDIEKAREWQQFSVRFVNILIKYGGGVRGGKALMKLIGLDCGPCRLPINNFDGNELNNYKKDLEEIDFFKYCEKIEL